MNTSTKPVVVMECGEKNALTEPYHTFEVVGSKGDAVKVRLAHTRAPSADGKGNALRGLCPLHEGN